MSKTALITGASSGLGFDFVKLFAKDGYNLVLVARNEKKLMEIKADFQNIDVTVIAKDLSVPGASKEIYDELQKQGIAIDVLVNNAGFGLSGKFEEIDLKRQTEMINLNITALTELTHYFLPQMKQRNAGKILNVASTAAFIPGPLMAVYFATKAYVLSFSEALCEELVGSNVSVTTLCPGATKTNFGAVANVEDSKMFSSADNSEEVAKQGYHALLKGQKLIITGGFNKMAAFAPRFLPRKTITKISKKFTAKK
jgi:uncharacterized protein